MITRITRYSAIAAVRCNSRSVSSLRERSSIPTTSANSLASYDLFTWYRNFATQASKVATQEDDPQEQSDHEDLISDSETEIKIENEKNSIKEEQTAKEINPDIENSETTQDNEDTTGDDEDTPTKPTRKKRARIQFSKEPECEIFLRYIKSRQLDKAEEILEKYGKMNANIQPQHYNQLLRAWFAEDNWQRGWKFYKKYYDPVHGIKPNPRTFTVLISASIRKRITGVLPMLFKRLQQEKIRPERLLAERFYRKEGSNVPILPLGPSVDTSLCVKLPPGASLPNNYQPNVDVDAEAAHGFDKESLLRRQYQREDSIIQKRVVDLRRDLLHLREIGRGGMVGDARGLLLNWFGPLSKAIEERLAEFKDEKSQGKPIPEYQQQILLLSADKLAVIVMYELLNMCLMDPLYGPKFTQVCTTIGQDIQAEIQYHKHRTELSPRKRKRVQNQITNTHKRISFLKHNTEMEPWSEKVVSEVGAELISIVERTLTTENINGRTDKAFTHGYNFSRAKKIGIIRCHEDIFKHINPFEVQKECYDPKLLPTIIPPKPWAGTHDGGYLFARTRLMRSYSKHQQMALKTTDLSDFYDVMNVLSAVPWKINRQVFDVVKEAWDIGGGLPYMPMRKSMSIPTPPDMEAEDYHEQRFLWRKQARRTERKNMELHSLRCDFSLKLLTATTLENEPCFYFPHNIDFRGRTYPIPPHLNHMGHDLSRGILQFATGKPLGQHGLYWLKAHLGSLCGMNKISFDDRVKFVDDHMDEILDSAANPLGGRRWWLEADRAWQSLGVCMELAEIAKCKDPTKFISYVPVHMDGSCNGLQHYAALGGDIEGGRSVNLLPAEAPQDVYTHVLNGVLKKLEEDLEQDHPLAKKLHGKVIRKTIKQTVMTFVYGVTRIGARAQIQGQLKDQGVVADEDLFATSNYLTELTFHSMQTMFTQAREIMKWLGDTARYVCKSGAAMSWTTPIGIPVEQHYRRAGKMQVKTLLQNITLVHTDDLPVLVQKQRSAFPPNYVHSLDSSHMFYTAKLCNQNGITFAAVHDSYWTHACDIPQMNSYLRDAFVTLHSRPLLHELRSQLQEKHPELDIKPFPVRGPLDIKLVKDSKYFFH